MSGRIKVEGPDWEDVSTYMDNLRTFHGVECSIKLIRAGQLYNPGFFVIVDGGAPQLTAPGQPWHITIQGQFPCRNHKTIEGLAFELLYQLDARASKELWKQAKLPLAEGQ